MADNRILKLVDSSYKECEVTGRDMGGDDIYEIAVANLKHGYVEWPQKGIPGHSVNVMKVGEDYVTLKITNVSGSVDGPYTLYVGEKKRSSYYFGEWSYGYAISVEEGDEEKL